MSTIIDYTLTSAQAANPDGTAAATFAGATPTTGPGSTPIGTFAAGITLDPTSPPTTVDLSGTSPDSTRFAVELVVRIDAAATTPLPLLGLDPLGVSVTAVPAPGGGFTLVAATAGGAVPGSSVQSTTVVAQGEWATVSVVFDTDTLALFVNRTIEAVHAYAAPPMTAAGATFTVPANPVSLARILWTDEIDPALETALDDQRDGGQWAITLKREMLGAGFGLGDPQGAIGQDAATGAWVQHYAQGLIMWSADTGVACEMHGAIWDLYMRLDDRGPLGVLISDEQDAGRPGSRRSTFTAGTIYWSSATGPIPVIGHLYVDYERLGGPAGFLGLPTEFAVAVPNGLEQAFQGGHMFFRSGAGAAHEAHGAILAQFTATGGVGRWGFPVGDETDATRDGAAIGRLSEFEGATFYWSGASGAHEVHGELRDFYRLHRGPAGELGFPTSDEMDVPGGSGRMNTFEHGALTWNGSPASIIEAFPFVVHIGIVDTVNSEGAFMGDNDQYGKITVRQGGSTLYSDRWPASGDLGGHDSVDWNRDVPVTVVPTADPVTVTIDVWDSDDGAPFGGGDDHLGLVTVELNPANSWGYAIDNGIITTAQTDKVKSLRLTLKPQIDPSTLTPDQLWWGATNAGTDTIPYNLYATAFSDVDASPEDYDPTDWPAMIYYAAATEHIARGGNCFGMCVAAIDAIKGTGAFGQPLSRYVDANWHALEPTFNVKHQYQLGEMPIWWFVGQFLSGRTHSPKAVFQATRDAYARGDNPVLCLSQNADFSGAPHCLMPVGWDDSGTPWRLMLQDPNYPASAPRALTVDPDADSFHYDGGNVYDGTSSSGGRMHWMPYSLLCHSQTLPLSEALLALVLGGVIIALGDGADSAGITDTDGNDLDATGDRARAQGGRLDGYFMPVKGSFGSPTPGDGKIPPVRIAAASGIGTAAARKIAAAEAGAESKAAGTIDATAATVDASAKVDLSAKVGGHVDRSIDGRFRLPGGVVPPFILRRPAPVAGALLVRPSASARDVVLTAKLKGGIVVKPFPIDRIPLDKVVKVTQGVDVVPRAAVAARSAAIVAALSATVAKAGAAASADLKSRVAVPFGKSGISRGDAEATVVPSLIAAASGDFVHHVTGSGSPLDHAVRHGLTTIRVQSPLNEGETTSIAVSGLSAGIPVIGLAAATAKQASVRIDRRLGTSGDHLTVELTQLPAGPQADLQVHVRPGLAGIDVTSAGAAVTVPVQVSGVIGGRQIGNRFDVPLQGGMRLAMSSLLSGPDLRAATITTIAGPATGVSMIAPS